MENEQTNKTVDTGDKDSSNSTEDKKPLSLYDKTEAIVTRQEAANKEAKEILERQEKLHANQRLAGTGGGHIEAKLVTPEQKKVSDAKEFFKDTALGDAIGKVHE